MDLKTFFGLHEGLIHEMAGMPQDNPFNEFLYKMLMKEYGYTWSGRGGAWPLSTPARQKVDDVQRWYKMAKAQGISPSNPNQSPESVVGQLNWPFLVGAGLKSKNAAANMRDLVVKIGFASQEDIDALEAEESKKAGSKGTLGSPASAPAGTKPGPRMTRTFKRLSDLEPAAVPPTVRKGGAAEPEPTGEVPDIPPAAEPEKKSSGEEKKSSETWVPGGRRMGGYKPPEDDEDFQ